MVVAFLHSLPISFTSCILKSYLKVPTLGCCHSLVMEDSLLRKVHLGFSSLLFLLSLRICQSLKENWWSWAIYIFSPLLEKKNSLRQSSRQQLPALLDTLCLPILELQGSRKRLRGSLQPVIVAHTFKMGCFAMPCLYHHGWVFHQKRNLAKSSVLYFLNGT